MQAVGLRHVTGLHFVQLFHVHAGTCTNVLVLYLFHCDYYDVVVLFNLSLTIDFVIVSMLFVKVAAVFLITGFAFQVRFFTQSSVVLIIILLIVWGFALVSLAMVLSNLFERTRTATLLCYLIIIFSVNFGVYFNLSVFKQERPMLGYWTYAPFVFYRGIYLMTNACASFQCLQVRSTQLVVVLFVDLLVLCLVCSPILFPLWPFVGCPVLSVVGFDPART